MSLTHCKPILRSYGCLKKISALLALFTIFAIAPAFAKSCAYSDGQVLAGMVLPFIDDVPYSAKPHILHRYGAIVTEHKTRPILVASTALKLYSGSGALVNSTLNVKFPEPQSPLVLKLAFADGGRPDGFSFALVLRFADKSSIAYRSGEPEALAALAKSIADDKKIAKSGIPPDEAELFDISAFTPLTEGACGAYLHDGIEKDIQTHGAVSHWALLFSGAEDSAAIIRFAGIFAAHSPAPPAVLTGSFAADPVHTPAVLHVDYENGEKRQVWPSFDGRFAFIDEYPDQGMRVSLHKDGQEFYPAQGRWLGQNRAVGPMLIDITREFANLDGALSDAACPSGKGLSARALFKAIQRPGHVVQEWCGGAGTIQEFYAKYFVNQIGMHDQDFSEREVGDCIRIAHLGHSDVEARHVPLYAKHNILASEFLSMALGRCVQIATFEGDFSIVSEPRIDWIVKNFHPDAMIFATHRQMIQLLTPDLLTAVKGYKYGEAALESFDISADGVLKYVPEDPDYALKKLQELQPDIEGFPLSLAYDLPMDVMPAMPRKAFDVVSALIGRYKEKYPGMKFAIEYSHTIAECAKASYCAYTGTLNGKQYPAGAVDYAKNMEDLCRKSGAACLSSALPDERLRGFPDLVFQFDTHFTRLGNFWQAGNVFAGLLPILK